MDSQRLQGVSWGCSETQGLSVEGYTSKLTHMIVSRIQFLTNYWTRPQILDSSWPKASLSSLPRGPLHRAVHHMAAGFIRVSRSKTGEQKGQSLTFAIFSSLEAVTGPAHAQGERITQEYEHRRQESLTVILKAACCIYLSVFSY